MGRIDDLRRRAELGDIEARMAWYRLEGRAGSRVHLETLALAEQIGELDPTLGEAAAFQEADARYAAVREKDWKPMRRTLEHARSLKDLYDIARTLDLTVKVHWGGVHNIDRDHVMIAEHTQGQRTIPVSARVLEVVLYLESQ